MRSGAEEEKLVGYVEIRGNKYWLYGIYGGNKIRWHENKNIKEDDKLREDMKANKWV